jgi:hypothetical protein
MENELFEHRDGLKDIFEKEKERKHDWIKNRAPN